MNEFRTSGNAWYWNEDNTSKTTNISRPALQWNYDLEKIAIQRAAELAILFKHDRPSGGSYTDLNSLGVQTGTIGENIAWG